MNEIAKAIAAGAAFIAAALILILAPPGLAVFGGVLLGGVGIALALSIDGIF